ncbi:MAG: chemotaxis protein CheW [Chromatiales bacterium]|jgi:purine-binding chemotaxis protein CheW|nr:chemotaxis protein CheW [Chromatiales bacterium]
MNVAEAMQVQSHAVLTTAGSQYLTFVLAGEEYGIDILRVQEIRGWTAVTPIPNTQEYVQGVLNLRGVVIPIIDLRRRLGMARIEYGTTTVIVVVNIISEGRRGVAGLVVDGVSDVYSVMEGEIKPTPEFGAAVDVKFIAGMAALGEKMVVLLDVDKLL